MALNYSELIRDGEYYTYGKYWGVVHKNKIVSMISMRAPLNSDFDTYREKAKDVLSTFGKVIAGEVIEHEGQVLFFERINGLDIARNREQPTYEIPDFKKPISLDIAEQQKGLLK